MSGDTGIQLSEFETALASIDTSCAAITPSVADVAEIVCQSDTMRRYRIALSDIGALMEQYKTLLVKDRDGFESVCDAIERLDRWVAAHMRMS